MAFKTGTLYGIGVGPGDPELIPVKSVKILQSVPHIFAARSSKNDYSLALNITRHYVENGNIEQLPFPMTKNEEMLRRAWEANAHRVMEVLAKGTDAAFVTIGDPLTYSTYGYLLKTLKGMHPEVNVVTIPGITSYHAAAAAANVPLAEGEESFFLVSGAMGDGKLREVIQKSENVVLLKTYRHFDKILEALEEYGLAKKTVCISHCGLEEETVVENIRDLRHKKLPYLSLLLIKRSGNDHEKVE